MKKAHPKSGISVLALIIRVLLSCMRVAFWISIEFNEPGVFSPNPQTLKLPSAKVMADQQDRQT